MAVDFSLPSWLQPKEAPWHALVAGVQAGSQIASNMLRAKQLYADMQQQRQRQDLAEKSFVANNEAQTLQNEFMRLKMVNDAADFSALRDTLKEFETTDDVTKVKLPALRDPQRMEKMSTMYAQRMIQAGNEKLAKFGSTVTNWADPAVKIGLLEIGVTDPYTARGEMWKTMTQFHEDAIKHKSELDKEKTTAAMANLAAADRADAEAIAQVDPAKAEALRRNAVILRSTNVAPTETLETYTDDNGEKQFRVVRGPSAGAVPKDLTAPTAATASQIQQRLLSAEKGVELGMSLMSTLTDADVGVRGNVNQIVINEGLAQLIPGLQKGQVTEARTMLGQFKENALKAIASDPRISNADAKRLEKILPTLGTVESVQSAKDKIKTFVDRFREQSRTDAVAAKIPIPNWALTITELREKVSKGELTEDEAVKIIVKYH